MAIILKDNRPYSNVVGETEWKARVDLAAFYRIAAIHGLDDFLYTHISARIPGPEKHFLINPFGLTFDEITASSLVKIDLDGNIIGESRYAINQAGFIIHSAVHAAREDAHFIAHFHTPDGTGVSAHAGGLLPITQRALYIIPHLSYHDYEGVAVHLDERERLVRDLGDNDFMILRNHGTLAVGRTPGEAWTNIYQLEAACAAQVRALAGGHAHLLIAPETAQEEMRNQVRNRLSPAAEAGRDAHADIAWQAVLRRIARDLPGFDQ